METWIIIAILVVAGVIVVIAILRGRQKTKKPQRRIQTQIDYGNYLGAGRLYLNQKRHREAADLYFRMPPEHRPAYERMILEKLGQHGAQLFWITAGKRYERINPEQAREAYLLGGAYFDAIKMFINRDDTARAVELVSHIPPKIQENTVRRLAQYAFDRGKYHLSAELLRALGFVEEADAILAVAAHDFGAIERPQAAAEIYDSVGRQDLAGSFHEQQGEKALSEGRVREAKIAFEKAIEAYDESNQPKDATRVEARIEKFELLDRFRNLAAEGRAREAEEMIEEVSSNFPGIVISDLYAEIASILEKSGRPAEAVTYYDKAADATKNPLKRQGYVNALRRIGAEIASKPVKGAIIAVKDLNEKCIVCKKPIKAGDKYVLCPNCNNAAHYAHFLEWLKVQGSCPNCHARIKVDEIKSE